jgi:hypothetical protein
MLKVVGVSAFFCAASNPEYRLLRVEIFILRSPIDFASQIINTIFKKRTILFLKLSLWYYLVSVSAIKPLYRWIIENSFYPLVFTWK